MTISEFLDECANHIRPDEKFFVPWDHSRIRSEDGYCPICWLASKLGKNRSNLKVLTASVSKAIGLSDQDRELIIDAADWPRPESHPAASVRQHLLQIFKPEWKW